MLKINNTPPSEKSLEKVLEKRIKGIIEMEQELKNMKEALDTEIALLFDDPKLSKIVGEDVTITRVSRDNYKLKKEIIDETELVKLQAQGFVRIEVVPDRKRVSEQIQSGLELPLSIVRTSTEYFQYKLRNKA